MRYTDKCGGAGMKAQEILTLVISFASIIISILTFLISKRKNTNEIITKNRLDWISQVRTLLQEFLKEYINNEPKANLLITRNKIALYFREGVVSYSKLLNQIDRCIEYGYDKENCDKLISEGQNVFSEVWIRMKREAGINEKTDKKYEMLFGNISKH